MIMIRLQWKKHLSIFTFFIAALGLNQAVAQGVVNDLVKGGVEDANKLLKAYAQPFGESFGVNLNSGWINTAAPLKPGRFELKVVGNTAFVPVNSRTYNLDALGFRNPVTRTVYGEPAIEQWEYNNAVAPTVFGASNGEAATIRKTLTYQSPLTGQEETQVIAELPLPGGLGIGVNPLPVVPQLSVGLPLGTEIMVRYLPAVSLGSGPAAFRFEGLWGLGLKHSIKQWIPVVSQLPFSLSVAAGYTSSKTGLGFKSVIPAAPAGGEFADPNVAGTAYDGPSVNETDYSGQGVALSTSAWNVNLLISKKVALFSAYGGLRYARSTTNLVLTGVYGVAGEPYFNVNDLQDPNNNKYTLVNTEKDPVNIDMPIGQLGVVGGFRVKLGVVSLFAEGNLSRYSTVSAGVGFGWMN